MAEALPELPEIFAGLASFISDIWKAADQVKTDETIIRRAAILMDRAWATCGESDETPDDSYREWLTSAINHEGGWIGEFWVHYCSQLRQRAAKEWVGIPQDLKSKMREAIQGTNRIKVYARIAMTPWMGYIYFWDKNFATEYFLPLLDWQRRRIVQMRLRGVFAYRIIDKLIKSPLLDAFPKDSCRYVNAITRGEDNPFLHDHHSLLHSRFKLTISGTPEFKEFEELLYLRGWKK